LRIYLKVGVLYSGGKDSTYAAYIAKKQGYELTCLITMMPESSESYLFHYPNIAWTDLQSQALDVPIVKTKLKTVGESEVQELAKAIKKAKEKHFFEGVVTGGLASRYQKDRIEAVSRFKGYFTFLDDESRRIHAEHNQIRIQSNDCRRSG
jgi:uncharacterized protein (TIGR00290 family)